MSGIRTLHSVRRRAEVGERVRDAAGKEWLVSSVGLKYYGVKELDGSGEEKQLHVLHAFLAAEVPNTEMEY
jgi:hypothetical protein